MSDGVLGLASLAVGDPGPAVGYAFKLRTLLTDRYTAQTFSVTDEGVGGETVIRRSSEPGQCRARAVAGRLEP